MARFHINDQTGEVGRCKAQHSCPFGDLQTDHYSNKNDARQAYEKTMRNHLFSSKRRKATAVAAGVLIATFTLTGCKVDISLPQETPTPTSTSSVTPSSTPSSAAPTPSETPTPDNTQSSPPPPGTTTSTPSGTPTDETPPGVKATLDKLNTLKVQGRAPKTGYDRDEFVTSSKWRKTQQATLKRDLTDITIRSKDNIVESGTLVQDPYTGKKIFYVIGGKSEIDVDHVVALGNAWESGIQYQSADVRLAFATDPDNLLAVDSSANRQKGDGDAATWLPIPSYRCTYVTKQINIKAKYSLTVTPAEKVALEKNVKEHC